MYEKLPLPESWGRLYTASAPERNTKQLQHAAAHALLGEALTAEAARLGLPTPVLPPELAYGEYGKPHLPAFPTLHFNLSHCRGLALCLFSAHSCGVDAEPIQPLRPRVAERVCSLEEQAALQSAADPNRLFMQLWTLKEAYVKAIGIGISYPMREVSFTITEQGVHSNRTDAQFAQFLLPEHVVSVCILTNQQDIEKGASGSPFLPKTEGSK